ncbi:MAG: hypothetical protein DRP37_02435 [Thermodesulfobacteriota bacterium]|nr:MAG: hypothetical protein DRP37_02435 [Thermodesulfobacteriota bacterium]
MQLLIVILSKNKIGVRSKPCCLAFLVLSFLLTSSAFHPAWSAPAETGADRLLGGVSETVEVRKETQKEEDAWAGKKAELTARLRSLEAEREHLSEVKDRTIRAIETEQALIAEAKRKIREAARIREGLESYLASVVTELEAFIQQDLPFLKEEREARLASISDTLSHSEKTAAEKYRRVMEALQVETEYGWTVEVYQETVDIEGQPIPMDIFRLGRLSLFCQSPDGKMVGHYDRTAGQWIELPSRYRQKINKAVDMARKQRTVDLVRLPIGRIVVP